MPVTAVSTFFGAVLAGLILIPIAALWCFAVWEIIVNRKTGWGVVGWLLLVCVLPIIGPITYFAVRPPRAAPDEAEQAYLAQQSQRQEAAARPAGSGMYR